MQCSAETLLVTDGEMYALRDALLVGGTPTASGTTVRGAVASGVATRDAQQPAQHEKQQSLQQQRQEPSLPSAHPSLHERSGTGESAHLWGGRCTMLRLKLEEYLVYWYLRARLLLRAKESVINCVQC